MKRSKVKIAKLSDPVNGLRLDKIILDEVNFDGLDTLSEPLSIPVIDIEIDKVRVNNSLKVDKKHLAKPQDVPFIHNQLLQALYWAFDMFERAAMPFFLVYSTAESVLEKKELEGSAVHVGVRVNEWTSGARRVAEAYKSEDPNTFEFTSLEGVPIILHIFEDDACIRVPDSQIYYNEVFSLPNPYSRFLELYK